MGKHGIVLILTFTIQIKGMEKLATIARQATSWLTTQPQDNQLLFIKTKDNKVISCEDTLIEESSLLTLAHHTGLFNNKNKALSVKITKEDMSFFFTAIKNKTPEYYKNLSLDKQYLLLTLAYKLRAPYLYAYLIQELVPSDIDNYIAQLLSPIKNIKKTFLTQNIPTTTMCITKIPLLNNSIMKIENNNQEKFCIVSINGTLLNNAPYYLTVLLSLQNKQIIQQWTGYKLSLLNPTKNIIALGSTNQPSKEHKCPTLLLYNIDTNTVQKCCDIPLKFLLFSPDGKYLAVTYHDKTDNHDIGLWTLLNQPIYQDLKGHSEPIEAITFHPNSTSLISGSPELNRSVILWNIDDDSVTSRTLLSNQHRHFKQFIFSKTVPLVLAHINKTISFLFTYTTNDVHVMRLKTPFYAFYNAPTIPTDSIILYDQENQATMYNTYTMTSPYTALNDNYVHVTSDQFNYKTAIHAMDDPLTLYSFSSHKKNITKTKLEGHCDKIQSLQFSKDGFLLSACPHKAILWNDKGKTIFSIPSAQVERFHAASFSKNDQLIFIASLIKHHYHPSELQIHTVELYNKETSTIFDALTTSLTTLQAITLKILCKQHAKNNSKPIKNNSFQYLELKKLSNAAKSLLDKTLNLTYTD